MLVLFWDFDVGFGLGCGFVMLILIIGFDFGFGFGSGFWVLILSFVMVELCFGFDVYSDICLGC